MCVPVGTDRHLCTDARAARQRTMPRKSRYPGRQIPRAVDAGQWTGHGQEKVRSGPHIGTRETEWRGRRYVSADGRAGAEQECYRRP